MKIIERDSFSIHVIDGYISNMYLAEYGHGLLMIDSGSVNDVKRVEEYCRKSLGRPMTDIKLCVVSHMHPDHAGGADLLRKKHGIPVAAHTSVDAWYRGVSGSFQHKLDCIMEQYVGRARGRNYESALFPRKLRPDFRLENGDRLPFFNDWTAVHVPGHTLHDLAFFHEKEKILHAGDCIVNVRGDLRLPIPVFFQGTMKQSFYRLSKLGVKTILPGHGDMIRTDDVPDLFSYMSGLVDEPRNDMSKAAHGLSMFAPEVWKAYLKKIRSSR